MIISRHIFVGKFSARILAQPCSLMFKFRKRLFQSSIHDHAETQLTQTNILVQEGSHIQEVPLVVRRITDVEVLFDKRSKKAVESTVSNKNKKSAVIHQENIPHSTSVKKNGSSKHSISIETDEGTAILFFSDIRRLKNTDVEQVLDAINSEGKDKGIYSLLESRMADEINCRIALKSLRKMIELENGWYKYRRTLSSNQPSAEAINRDIILRQLVNLIIKSRDNEMILQGLKALKRDRYSPSKNFYKDRMCNEVMIRATDGNFTISQLIRAVKILASYKDPKYRNCIDTLWAGLAYKKQDIKPNLLVPLFRSLIYFNRSKIMVQIILEEKLSEQWLKLTGSQMAHILDCLYGRESSKGCLSSASKWANVSMTTSTETDLINFISSLHMKKYIDENVEQALARYMTAKSAEIKHPNLIATIMDYCKDLKIRNPYILAECGKYFMKRGMEIPPSLLSLILIPFGLLNVRPPDAAEFWKIFDEVINARFSDLKLNDILDILLSCTYLERYPIKFLDKVFNTYIVNRLQSQKDAPLVNSLKTKLKLFDATMSLECKDYQGSPVNLDCSTKSLSLDTRIRGIVNKIHKPLAHLVGGEHKLSRSVVLNRLPLINFYILDILVHPLLKSTSVFNLNLHKKRNVNTAILIQLPEYYCWNTRLLIGPQIMRKRQIRKLGFRVTCLDYTKLTEVADQDDKMLSYLSQSLDAAENAL
ncbi:FAST kinase domain-containing protein 3, mitochondrial-like [Linepithema humile]|uniref:FAST kinase domain-containing protein 3, mitochondrial-like n=1 Tax=Linepithema humile TaxID=83485 RepID=UPI00351E4D80